MSTERKPGILIVDRRLRTLTSLETLLSREGYCVTTCSSPAEALKAVVGQRLDLVIAGRGGSERHGAAFVSKIKNLSPETRILLLIESNDDSDGSIVTDAIAAGADGLLRRSYSESQVIQRVERLLHGAQTSRGRRQGNGRRRGEDGRGYRPLGPSPSPDRRGNRRDRVSSGLTNPSSI